MTRLCVRVVLILTACFPLLLSNHAYPQSVTTIELYADNATSQASNNGVYPLHSVATGTSLCWSQTANALPATVAYNGPASVIYCSPSNVLYLGANVNGPTVLNFGYATGGIGTHSVQCTANGVIAEVQFTLKNC